MISELAKGFLLTLRYFFRRGITIQYPDKKREPSPGYRGLPALRKHPDGRERCVACCLCEAVCPARCIHIETDMGPAGEKRPVVYDIDISRCLFCGLCAEVCPEEAVVLTGRYEFVYRERRTACLDKTTLLGYGEGL